MPEQLSLFVTTVTFPKMDGERLFAGCNTTTNTGEARMNAGILAGRLRCLLGSTAVKAVAYW